MAKESIGLSDGEKTVTLPDAQIINISSSYISEKQKGESTIRFLLGGESVLTADPFDTVSRWYDESKSITLEVGDFAESRRLCRQNLLAGFTRQKSVRGNLYSLPCSAGQALV